MHGKAARWINKLVAAVRRLQQRIDMYDWTDVVVAQYLILVIYRPPIRYINSILTLSRIMIS